MKIVTKDNLDKDYFQEEVIAENVNKYIGYQMVDAWNDKHWNDNSGYYLWLEEDDYEIFNESPY